MSSYDTTYSRHCLIFSDTCFYIKRSIRLALHWAGTNFALSLFMMKMNALIFILVSTSVNAFAWQVQEIDNQNWLTWIRAKPSVFNEINKYFKAEDSSNDATEYIQEFVPAMHDKMVDETYSFMNAKAAQSACKPSIDVSFPEQITEKHAFDSIKDFESNFLKVESYTCLGKLDLDKVFETLMSESFQRKAINGLKNIKLDPSTNKACVETKIFGLGTSNYCLTKNVQKTVGQYVIQSFNEENLNKPDAPVYFKETINVITRLPNGEISLYNLMYARSVDLSFTGVIRSKVKEQQDEVKKYLIEGAQ